MIRYKAGGYLRLSDKDLHLDPHEQSESIENQKSIILNYVEKNPDIELVDFFIDDGYTGLNYDREGFRQLMNCVDRGEINMIITKELSRLGREHAETIQLFKKDFVLKKIRYVAVIDNIDFNGRIEGLEIPFKVLINDYYSQALSNTVTNTLRTLQKKGKYVAAFTPYGYQKDQEDKHHLVIDEEAANVVKKIYQYYIDGKSIDWICRRLTEDKEPSPAEYKAKTTNFKCKKALACTNYWTYTTVWKILKDETYLGYVVQHRREKVAYNLPQFQKVPEQQIIKKKGMHEAIVSKEEYEIVQTMMKSKRRMRDKDIEHPNLFAGIIVCADCGRSLGRVKDHHYTKWYYRCNTYARMGKNFCSCHKIYEADLKEIVLQEIRKNALDTEIFQNFHYDPKALYDKTKRNNLDLLQKFHSRLEKLESERAGMISKLAKEILTEQDFLFYKTEYEKEKEQLQFKITALKNQINDDNIINREYKEWIEGFIKYKELGELTREIVINLISKVIIHENKGVEIQFKFKNPFQNS